MRILVFLLLFMSAASFNTMVFAKDECNEFASAVATTPAPPSNSTQFKAAMQVIKSVPTAADIVLVGDSILHRWSDQLVKNLPGKTVYDFAVPGDTTQQVLWRFQQVDLTNLKPTAVVVLIGTNNLPDKGTSGCSVFQGINAIVEKSRKTWPGAVIFVSAVAPRGADFRDFDDIRKNLNGYISEIGSLNNVFPFAVDDLSLTCGKYAEPRLLPSNNLCELPPMYTCANYAKDNLHVADGGYSLMRDVLGKVTAAAMKTDIFN